MKGVHDEFILKFDICNQFSLRSYWEEKTTEPCEKPNVQAYYTNSHKQYPESKLHHMGDRQ